MLSQFLRDTELYKNHNSQEDSLSQSLSQDLTINSDKEECKDISSTETTDYEASQMVLTQCPKKFTQKLTQKVSKPKEKSFKGSSELSSIDMELEEELENVISANEIRKACSGQDITITTTTATTREVGVQCNLFNSDKQTVSVQTEMSFRKENNNDDGFGKRRKVTLRLGLPRKYKKVNVKNDI